MVNKDLIPVLDTIGEPESLVALSTQERRTILDEKVRNLILKGKSRPQVMKFIISESKRLGYENTESHASNIYHQVKSSIKKELEEEHDELLADITSKLYYLYEQNINNEDLKEARECIKEIAKMAGIGGNQVNIAKKDNDEIIQINFG